MAIVWQAHTQTQMHDRKNFILKPSFSLIIKKCIFLNWGDGFRQAEKNEVAFLV